MESFIFLSFTAVFFLMGLRFVQSGRVEGFIALVVLFPFTPSLISLHTKFQFTVYYAFLFFPIISYFFGFNKLFKVSRATVYTYFYFVMFTLIYLLISKLLRYEAFEGINILKDLKPLIFIVLGFALIDVFRENRLSWDSHFADKLLKVNFLVTLVIFFLLSKTSFFSLFINDSFYTISEDVRYISFGAFYCLFFFLSKISRKKKLDFIQLVYIFIPVLLTGNRTFLITISVVLIFNFLFSRKKVKALIKNIFLFFSGCITLFLIFTYSKISALDRILTLVNVDLLFNQLREYRFAPYIEKIKSFEWYHFIMGKGIGATFYIPWFEWRENIKNENIYMDNIYLTLYMKYGLFCILIFYLMYLFISKTSKNKRYKSFVVIYFLIMGLTTAYMYQTPFMFLILILAAFDSADNNNNNNNNFFNKSVDL